MKKASVWLFLVTGLLYIVSFSILVCLFLKVYHGSTGLSELSNCYRVYKLNYDTNETTSSTVRTSALLDENEVITYHSHQNRELVVVTRVSTDFFDNYYCSGTCYCNDEYEEYRRSSLSVMSIGRILVSASSVLIATQLAAYYFTESCQTKYSDCEDMTSLVDDCTIHSNTDETIEAGKDHLDTSVSHLSDSITEESDELISYHCEGQCLGNLALRRPETVKEAKRFECSRMMTGGYVFVSAAKQRPFRDHRRDVAIRVKQMFLRTRLIKYCREGSSFSYNYKYYREDKNAEGIRYAQASLCVASHSGRLENISCRQADPPKGTRIPTVEEIQRLEKKNKRMKL